MLWFVAVVASVILLCVCIDISVFMARQHDLALCLYFAGAAGLCVCAMYLAMLQFVGCMA